jgi:tungstate transport system permease protein
MVLVFSSALMGIPPVVVGLIVYLLLSRAGPLGDLGLLFTRQAMVMAQVLLTFPIVVVLTYRVTSESWQSHGDALRIDGAKAVRCAWALLHMNGTALVTVFLAAFGRAIAEVGAIVLVGGNIRGDTRTMTTAIALETAKGELAVAMGLGIILLTLIVLVSAAVYEIERRLPR